MVSPWYESRRKNTWTRVRLQIALTVYDTFRIKNWRRYASNRTRVAGWGKIYKAGWTCEEAPFSAHNLHQEYPEGTNQPRQFDFLANLSHKFRNTFFFVKDPPNQIYLHTVSFNCKLYAMLMLGFLEGCMHKDKKTVSGVNFEIIATLIWDVDET